MSWPRFCTWLSTLDGCSFSEKISDEHYVVCGVGCSFAGHFSFRSMRCYRLSFHTQITFYANVTFRYSSFIITRSWCLFWWVAVSIHRLISGSAYYFAFSGWLWTLSFAPICTENILTILHLSFLWYFCLDVAKSVSRITRRSTRSKYILNGEIAGSELPIESPISATFFQVFVPWIFIHMVFWLFTLIPVLSHWWSGSSSFS